MMKILAGLGALTAAIVAAVVIATSSGDTPADQTEAEPTPALAPRAEAQTDSQYDYQTVWALFEHSCRANEFMDNECSCMMNSLSAAHGMDAVAYLALMGWDRFDEAGVIADRLGEDRIRAAGAFYEGKADGACARDQLPVNEDASTSTSATARADAETTGPAGEEQQAGRQANGGTSQGGNESSDTADQAQADQPVCALDNAISLPGNLGVPIIRIKNGEVEALNLLSGGNRQRVALARADTSVPDLLLLDEPTINLDPTEIATLEECVIYVGGRARFGVGPQREFTGKLTVAGSDIPVTAGAEYVVWNEADGTTTRQPINQSFTLPASQSDMVVFLVFGFSPTAYFDPALVNLETTNSGILANIIMPNMALMMVLSGGNLNDFKSLLAKMQGLYLGQPLPLDEVILVPPGELELSWDREDPNSPTIKACFAAQQALLNLLRDLGYDASSSLAIIGRAIREARSQDTDVCETLKATALFAVFYDSIGALPISVDNGPGIHLIDLSD